MWPLKRVKMLNDDEYRVLKRAVASCKIASGKFRKAKIALLSNQGHTAREIAERLDCNERTALKWIGRFNRHGVASPEEVLRSGRPRVYGPEDVGVVIQADLTLPQELGLPFASWTLDRLVAYLKEEGRGHGPDQDRRSFGGRGPEVAQAGGMVRREGRSRVRRKKGAIERLYASPPSGSVVICIDEMSPLSVRPYPARRLVRGRECGLASRARWELELDRDRKFGGYVFGAFVPASGEAFTATYTSRSIATFVDFLEKVEAWVPDSIGRVYAIMDNLRAHKAYDVLLFNVAHPRWEFVFHREH